MCPSLEIFLHILIQNVNKLHFSPFFNDSRMNRLFWFALKHLVVCWLLAISCIIVDFSFEILNNSNTTNTTKFCKKSNVQIEFSGE